MGSRFPSFSFLLSVLLVSLQIIIPIQFSTCFPATKQVYHLQEEASLAKNKGNPSSLMDPSLNIFFTTNDLKVGKKIPIYFSTKSPPHFLPKQESDSIPFSLSQLPNLLDFFSFPKHSPKAKAMEYTLSQCDEELQQSLKRETQFCATSLESMLDSTRGVFGHDTEFEVLTTKHLSRHTEALQNYTILENPNEILTPRIVACHTMPYPYAVFYCHGQESDHKVFEVLLGGDNGERVEAIGVCHVDTSQWDPDHVAFRVLKTRPGRSPVCHFFPADNLIWVASPSII